MQISGSKPGMALGVRQPANGSAKIKPQFLQNLESGVFTVRQLAQVRSGMVRVVEFSIYSPAGILLQRNESAVVVA